MEEKKKVQLIRPIVKRREQIAYEVMSLQRSAAPGLMIDDYIVDCARFIAKRTIIKMANTVEDVGAYCEFKDKKSMVLEVVKPNEDACEEICTIRWRHPIFHELDGELDLENEYGYTFVRELERAYFYEDWFDELITELQLWLDATANVFEKEEVTVYKWYIILID